MENVEKLNVKPEFNHLWYNSYVSCSSEKEALVSKVGTLIGKDSKTCLEIGLGTEPIFAKKIAGMFERYVVVEKEPLDNSHLDKNIQLIEGDWESVQLDQKFDIILASHVIYYFKDKQSALDKMFKHLAVGGKLILVVNSKEGDYGPTKSFFAEKIGEDYEFTYDQVLRLLGSKKIKEYDVSAEVTFGNFENLHSSLKILFDNYPREYEIYKNELIKYWSENLKENRFVANQKVIEVANCKYVCDSMNVLEESKKETDKYEIEINGRTFVVYPNVFSPKYFSDTKRFYEALPIKKGETVLEIGCGTGILSVSAALSGAEKVYATDINPHAVENTRENAELHGFSDKIETFLGDVYEAIPSNLDFDTIIWNGPFLHTEREDLTVLERSIFDKDYESLRKTIQGSKHYLKRNGKLIIGFSSTIGRLDLLNTFLKDECFDSKVIFKMQAPLGSPVCVGQEYDKITFELFEAKKLNDSK